MASRSARSWPWVAAGSRWSRTTRCSTTTCSTSRGANAGRTRPSVCFLPTASGDSMSYIAELLRGVRPACRGEPPRAVRPNGRRHRGASCWTRTPSTSAAATPRTCWPSGGVHGVDRSCARAWEAGVVLAGLSAGGELLVRGVARPTPSDRPRRRSTTAWGSCRGASPALRRRSRATADLPAADRRRDAARRLCGR